ncbi:unnamed protein product [Arabis nemorensis]|uniref:Uncharacterized protein n=1 Tax=Arabis nemorensis TaxID=586526 RepID=A0A565BB32_9BRAS|nr:unnamed protein product [Arabis nemorensis]
MSSSCTNEEVDAILIQCGKLSRSNSAAKTRRYFGSKRSFDFDKNKRIQVGGDVEEKEIERKTHRERVNNGSPRERRRQTPSTEREDKIGTSVNPTNIRPASLLRFRRRTRVATESHQSNELLLRERSEKLVEPPRQVTFSHNHCRRPEAFHGRHNNHRIEGIRWERLIKTRQKETKLDLVTPIATRRQKTNFRNLIGGRLL